MKMINFEEDKDAEFVSWNKVWPRICVSNTKVLSDVT